MSSTEPEELGFELPAPAKTSRGVIAVVLIGVVGGAFAVGYLQHRSSGVDAAIAHVETGAPIAKVEVIVPKTLQSDQALVLPGVVKALEETKMFPRTPGYVRKWNVDIGDKVKEGQLLAEIDTPDVDAQLAQARAQLAQAKASVRQSIAQRDYSKQSSTRYETLSDQKLVAKAHVEQQQAQAATDEASVSANESNVVAQEANVRRLMDMKQFASVTAPFAGTITTRNIERGALVQPTDTTPMFTLVATDPVRVFIDVPQTVAPSIKPGADAKIIVREFAGRAFDGKVTRSAGALDPDLHVMSTEVRVPNEDGALLPGMYVQAQLTLPVPHRVVEVPATALYNDASGVRVAVVDAQNKVKYAPITIERDTGATIWVATGLTGDERVVKIAVPSLVDGDVVEVAAAPAGEKK
jgi:RND family efflux transporter MFP subunit